MRFQISTPPARKNQLTNQILSRGCGISWLVSALTFSLRRGKSIQIHLPSRSISRQDWADELHSVFQDNAHDLRSNLPKRAVLYKRICSRRFSFSKRPHTLRIIYTEYSTVPCRIVPISITFNPRLCEKKKQIHCRLHNECSKFTTGSRTIKTRNSRNVHHIDPQG